MALSDYCMQIVHNVCVSIIVDSYSLISVYHAPCFVLYLQLVNSFFFKIYHYCISRHTIIWHVHAKDLWHCRIIACKLYIMAVSASLLTAIHLFRYTMRLVFFFLYLQLVNSFFFKIYHFCISRHFPIHLTTFMEQGNTLLHIIVVFCWSDCISAWKRGGISE